MNHSKHLILFLLTSFMFFSQNLYSQDSLNSYSTATTYSSFGFQGSFVSGIGLTYGKMSANRTQMKGTGGIISSDGETIFATGFDLNYSISNQSTMRIFVGPSIGVYGGSKELPKYRVGFGTGIEVPVKGNSFYQNISFGVVVYYPTYFFLSQSISFAGSVFLVYNY